MQPWMQQAHAYEQQYGIPQGLYVALIRQESGGNPNARSPVGAIGYAQLMPGTAAGMGINPHDPAQNLKGGAMYLSNALKRYNGNVDMALASYNAGPGAVAKYNGVPPYQETRNYIKRVNGFWGSARGQAGPSAPQVPAGPQGASQRPQGDPVALSNQINRIQNAYVDSPDLAAPHVDKLQAAFQGGLANPVHAAPGAPGVYGSAGGGMFKTPNGNVRNQLAGESILDFMQRLGRVGFGLVNDPGNAQTTGGHHADGSLHYQGRAVDWGTGRNPASRLQAFYDWAKPRATALGTEELIWQQPDHYDHLHWGRTSAPPSIKPANSRRRPVKRVRAAS